MCFYTFCSRGTAAAQNIYQADFCEPYMLSSNKILSIVRDILGIYCMGKTHYSYSEKSVDWRVWSMNSSPNSATHIWVTLSKTSVSLNVSHL